MRLKSNNGSINDLLVENKVVGNEIKEDIQESVATSTDCISECLDRHQFTEGPVKHINNRNDPLL